MGLHPARTMTTGGTLRSARCVILNYRHRGAARNGRASNVQFAVCLWRDAGLVHLPSGGRRVAILYGRGIFACRRCYRLAYPSQREAVYDRAARQADKIRDCLGWEPGILNGNGWKPKGMHWRTFERLTAEHDAFVAESLAAITRRFKLFDQTW